MILRTAVLALGLALGCGSMMAATRKPQRAHPTKPRKAPKVKNKASQHKAHKSAVKPRKAQKTKSRKA